MTDATEQGYPDFDDAEGQFHAFVRGQGLDVGILHVTGDDLILVNGEWFVRHVEADRSRSQARRAYDAAVTRGRGVSLTGCCILNDAICVHVYGPADSDEAERLMYPNGLKLSLLTDLPRAAVVGSARWAFLRGRQRLRPDEVARQVELLK